MPTKRILVIEDERYISDIIQTCLRKIGGWDVVQAYSGNDGLRLAQVEQWDAILLDVMMPDMNGLTVLQHLQNQAATQAIPVILLTAKIQPSHQTEYDQLAIAGVIAKPFEPLQLVKQIAELLDWG